MNKKTIIISAINFSEGGPLTIYKECLKYLEENFLKEYRIVALVHDRKLFLEYESKIEFIEFKARWKGAYIGELLPPNYETQDLNAIEEMLNSLGKFQIIKTDESLKIMGYQ